MKLGRMVAEFAFALGHTHQNPDSKIKIMGEIELRRSINLVITIQVARILDAEKNVRKS